MDDPPFLSLCGRKRNRKKDLLGSKIVVDLVTATPPNDFKAVRGTSPYPELEHEIILCHHDNSVIYIGHGCLIIPAVFLVWWYWTKRTARRVVHGVITFSHRGRSSSYMSTSTPIDATTTICNDNDNVDVGPCFDRYTAHASSSNNTRMPNESSHYYRSWDDTPPEGSSSDDTTKFRFIQWMKRTKTSRSRQTVRTTTLHNLHNNFIQKNEMNQKHGETNQAHQNQIHHLDDTHHRVDSVPKIVTQIQTPNTPTHNEIEMFVIEYPQQMSHPAYVTSTI